MAPTSEEFESMTLLDSQDYDVDGHSSTGQEKWLNRSTAPRTISFAVAIGFIFIFLIDVVSFAYIARMLLDARSLGDLDQLEFRNPYIGLDELYAQAKVKPSHYNTLVNEPRFATQISDLERNKVFPIDLHRWLSDFGLLSPPDRRFKVSNNIHTVLQFHILDYGMEKCAVAVRLPKRGEILPVPYSLPASGDSVLLDVCELDVARPLKEARISWSTRPPCMRSLGTIDARIGEEVEMKPFACKSGSFVGYQVSCSKSSPGCDIDVWTNQNATWGVYLNQYQTT